jgi:hypothetical protein
MDFAINMPQVDANKFCSITNTGGDLYLNISDGKPVGAQGVDSSAAGTCTQSAGCGYIMNNQGFAQ